MTDRLDLANAIEAAGIERKAAEHLAATIFDAIRENVATKADLQALESRMLLRMTEIENRIDRVVIRLGSLAIILWGLLVAALHIWPPHG
jgi:hypothetical protein